MTLFTHDLVVKSDRIHDGKIFNLRVDTLEAKNGDRTIREVIEHNGGVVIASLTASAEVVLIRQYRYSLDETIIELPAGRIEKGEDPLPAAQRELTEETGYRAQSWQKLAKMYSAPGFCNEALYIYRASDLTFVGKNLDPDEETEVIEVTLEQAWQMVASGEIEDAKTIAGLGLLSRLP